MLVVNSIEKGIVIDHITAGNGAKILSYLNIDTSHYTVAFLMNAESKLMGKKDIIKIKDVMDLDLADLGLLDPTATVNVIDDHKVVRKIRLEIPETVVNIIRCKNPRCVTSVEKSAPHIFHLTDREKREYRCEYCDDLVDMEKDGFNELMRKKRQLNDSGH